MAIVLDVERVAREREPPGVANVDMAKVKTNVQTVRTRHSMLFMK